MKSLKERLEAISRSENIEDGEPSGLPVFDDQEMSACAKAIERFIRSSTNSQSGQLKPPSVAVVLIL